MIFYYFFWLLIFKPRLRFLLLAGTVALGGYQAASYYRSRDRVSVTFLEIAGGDAVDIAFPGNRHWLIDGGAEPGRDTGLRVICPYLWARGVRRIERIFITHPDPAHYGGLGAVLENFPVGAVVYDPDVSAEPEFAALMEEIHRRAIPEKEAWAGDEFFAAGCTMTVLSPSVPGATLDDNCLVMRLTAYGKKIIFTGDAGAAAQAILARSASDLSADYLQVPGHGRRPADPALVKKVHPSTLIVSGAPRTDPATPAAATTIELTPRRAGHQ
jgi:competence protein ComEC